jgi:subtilase family protein
MAEEKRDQRRPLLVGGEKLRGKGSRAGRYPGDDEKHHPSTIPQAQARLRPQAAALAAGVDGLPERLRGEHVVFEATLEPNYIANSYFPDATLMKEQLYVVGTRQTSTVYKTKKKKMDAAPTKTLLIAGQPDRVAHFARAVADVRNSTVDWEEVREFSALNLPNASRVVRGVPPDLGEGELITWEAVLHPIGRDPDEWSAWLDSAFEKFVRVIKSLGGDVDEDFRRAIDGLTFVPVLLHKEGAVEATRFNLLRSIRPMPRLRSFPSSALRSSPSNQVVPVPRPTASTPLTSERVAIFDAGIPDALPHFAPFVQQHHLTREPPTAEGVAHGTGVTSAFLFGHLAPGKPLSRPIAYVDHYRVYPPPKNRKYDENLYWVLDRIEEVARQKRHHFVNLCFAPDIVIDDEHEPHRWTSSLDCLARKYGTTFVCAAGNNGRDDRKLRLHRVLVPSDMVNGVTVGACDASSAEPLRRAPYSPFGPGRPGQRVQPLGVHFGGRIGGEPFRTLDAAGNISEQEGTSFSAPLGTRGAVGLHSALPNSAHPPLLHVRTFFAHYAQRAPRHRLKEIGYGRLRERFDELPECGSHECSVLYEESLDRDETVAMNLPVPTSLPDDTPLRIVWTISYVSAVDSKDAFEYTLDGLEITFRPHARRVKVRDLNRPKGEQVVGVFDIERDAAAIRRLEQTTLIEVGDVPVPGAGWRARKGESRQREDGKWETVVCGEVEMPAGELFHPRLDVHYLRRSRGQLVKGDVPPLAVSMLATLSAPAGVDLYDRVTAEHRLLVPVTVALGTS